jgi:hypothetical protein
MLQEVGCIYCGALLPGGAQGTRHHHARDKAFLEGREAARMGQHTNPYAWTRRKKSSDIRNCKFIAWQKGHDQRIAAGV